MKISHHYSTAVQGRLPPSALTATTTTGGAFHPTSRMKPTSAKRSQLVRGFLVKLGNCVPHDLGRGALLERRADVGEPGTGVNRRAAGDSTA